MELKHIDAWTLASKNLAAFNQTRMELKPQLVGKDIKNALLLIRPEWN